MSGFLGQAGLAQEIAAEIALRSGVHVAPSTIEAHFAAENSQNSTNNNPAGLMSGGKLIQFPTQNAFANEYVNTVVPHLVGGVQQGFFASGSTINSSQYAGALQYGTTHAYCTSQCGTFYQVKPPNTSILSKLGITWAGFGAPGTAFGSGTQPLSQIPGGGTNLPGAASQILSGGGSTPWWVFPLVMAGLIVAAVVVFAQLVKPAAELAVKGALV